MAKRDHLTLLADCALPTFGRMEPRPTGFDREARRLSVSAHIGAEFADGRGVIRRGFFAALLDDVMTGAGPGDFTAEGWVVGVGPHQCLTRAELRAPSGEIAAVAQGVVAQDRDDAEAMNRLVLRLSSGANDEWRTAEQTAHPTPPERRLPPGSNSMGRRSGGDGR